MSEHERPRVPQWLARARCIEDMRRFYEALAPAVVSLTGAAA